MRVLGVESSCDETAVAVVEDGRLLAERVASQVDAHALFGGVVPEIAAREHLRVLPALADLTLRDAGLTSRDVHAVAVARGPGLLGCLLVGLGFAKGLAMAEGVPLVGVDHLRAHLLAAGLERELPFPAVGLLVSGGHTRLYRMDDPLHFTLMGRTLDDAAGEAFDKVAKLLNLPYPGGRLVDKLSRGFEPDTSLFGRPYLDNQNLDFSFSGLKTAVSEYLAAHHELALERMPLGAAGQDLSQAVRERLGPERSAALSRLLASFTWAVVGSLRIKAERALDRVPEARALVLAGGVAANQALRAAMAELATSRGLELVAPSPPLCTDNAAMVAYAGSLDLAAGRCHRLDLEAVPRGRAVPDDLVSCQGARVAGSDAPWARPITLESCEKPRTP